MSSCVIYLPSNPKSPDKIWHPRDFQTPAWAYLEAGGTRAVEIWHRRAGKDELCLAWAAVAAHKRIGTYWHMLPQQTQARKAIWDAVDSHRGMRRIDLAFPKEIRASTRESDMHITFKNGSTWQVIGSDNYDSLVGTPPVGLVFSEWALCNPYSWAYLRPILRENGGWALFITTARGKNHAYKMYQHACKPDNDWHAGFVTAEDTDVFSAQDLEEERSEYVSTYGATMGLALFNQEYLCSWEAAVPGAYWAEELNQLERDGRLTDVPYNPDLPVITSQDLGMNDHNVTFFWQLFGSQIRMIDVEGQQGEGLQGFIKLIKSKPYNYSQHIGPHDLKVRDWSQGGKSRQRVARDLGVKLEVAPSLSHQEGVDAFRRLIPRLWIDKGKCEGALELLRDYRAKFNVQNATLAKHAEHSVSSNWADSCRYFAVSPHKTKAMEMDEGPLEYA